MENAPVCIGSGITITLLTSIVLLAIFFPLKTQLLTLFGASENSIGMAIEYFNIILVFFPIFMLMNMMNKRSTIPFFFMGFVLAAYLKLDIIALAILGAAFGMLHLLYTRGRRTEENA